MDASSTVTGGIRGRNDHRHRADTRRDPGRTMRSVKDRRGSILLVFVQGQPSMARDQAINPLLYKPAVYVCV